MWFHFFTGNHNKAGRASLYDMMEWLTAGLTELKHDVTVGNTIAPHAINIIWENFRHEDEEIFKSHDFKFGLIATEIPVGRTFNWLGEGSWPTRRRSFDKIARRAQFIWSMVEEPVGLYQQWAPSGYLELGFSERIVDPIFAHEPQSDFGFYGLSITPYRNTVLEHLRKYCTITTPNRFLTGHDLNSFIASFKVGICLKHSPQWTIPSPARTARLLHAKRGIAAEYVPVRTRASAFTTMADKNQDFAEFCLECLRGPWQQRAEEAYDRFRAAMPMKQIMERLLDMTVAKSPTLSGATVLSASDDGQRDRVRFRASYQPRLIDAWGDYNVVRYAHRIYALHRGIGQVDLTAEDVQTLARRYGADAVIIADTIDEAQTQVEALSNQPLKRGGGVGKSARRNRVPKIVGDHLGFNIVRVPDGYLALRKSLGEVVIDRSAEDIVRDKGFAHAAFGKSMGEVLMHIHLATIIHETADAGAAARNLAGAVQQLDTRVRDQIESLHGALNEIRSSTAAAIDKSNRDLRDFLLDRIEAIDGTLTEIKAELSARLDGTSGQLDELSRRTTSLERDLFSGAAALQRSVLALGRRIKE